MAATPVPTHGQTLGSVEFETSETVLEILDINWEGIERTPIPMTSMAVQKTATSDSGNFGNMLFDPSILVNGGTLVLDCQMSPGVKIPIVEDPELILLKMLPFTADQWQAEFMGFIEGIPKINGPLDGKPVTVTIRIKVTDVRTDDGTYDNTGAVEVTLAT